MAESISPSPIPAPGDAAQPVSPGDAAEAAATEADARLVRATRWRLVAWSGGSTLIVLLVLGIALYLSVAGSLEASGVRLLEDRANELVGAPGRQPPGPDNPGY